MKNKYVQIGTVIFVTVIIVLMFKYINNKEIENYIFLFYLPGEFVSVSLLGGFHGAPQWSLYLGILLQNIVILFLVRTITKALTNEKNA